jgi:hypothetical protein
MENGIATDLIIEEINKETGHRVGARLTGALMDLN